MTTIQHNTDQVEKEVGENYTYFKDNFSELVEKYKDRFLVIRSREVQKDFETDKEAILWAMKEYPDGMFSVQEVSSKEINLGSISSYAVL